MTNEFDIIVVPGDAAEATEAMGTKFKFWFYHPELGYCLYKQARPNTGEDWAEKIAASLCELLKVPHARIELATWNNARGTVSPSFLPNGSSLILGNEILAPMVPEYPRFQAFNVSQHTLDVVLAAISNNAVNLPLNWIPPAAIQTAIDTFVGYLLLDAWIGNSDRHHENWGFIETSLNVSTQKRMFHLAPTYDHASSLGREMLDSKRLERLLNRSVSAYVDKCRSALYAQIGDKKALRPLDAFREAAQQATNAASVWLECLSCVSSTETLALFNRVPSNRISETAIAFAQDILEINQRRLLGLREELL